MLNDVVKAVSVNAIRTFVADGIEHVFVDTKQGALIHIMPHVKKVRLVHQLVDFSSTNRYYTSYSIISKAFYFHILSNELIEYYPLTGETNVYDLYENAGWNYSSCFTQNLKQALPEYRMNVATDGNIYMSAYLFRGLYGYARFNVTTKQIDDVCPMPDQEFTHIHGRWNTLAFTIDGFAGLNGVYSSYLFTDDYVNLTPTIKSEIAASGLEFNNVVEFYLHWEDRDIASATRRIYTRIGTPDTWKVIDIKSPTTYIDTLNSTTNIGLELRAPNWYACVDQLGNVLDKTGWTNTTELPNVAAFGSITMPSFDPGIAYGIPYQIGRFVYIGDGRLGNTQFYEFAIHPTTKEAIYPSSFDKWSTFPNNRGYSVYKCNFNGAFGFSTNDELVCFIKNSAGNLGFVRPDTNVWYEYNPVTDTSGYVTRAVSLYDINDPDGFGIRWGDSNFSQLTEITINNENCLVDAVGKSAVVEEYDQSVTGRLADVTFFVYPQKTRPAVRFEFEIPDLVVQTATISQAINTRDNLLVCVGRVYTGTTVIDQTAPTTFTLRKYIGGTGSPNGAWRIDNNRVFIAVYMGKQYIIDATDPDNATKISLVGGDVTEALYASVRPDGVVFSGVTVRTASHQGGFRLTHVNLSTYTVTGITNKFSTEFNALSSGTYRSLVGLPNNDYSDAAVEAAVQARMTTAGLTRAQVIAEFIDSCRWANSDMHSWGNYTVFGLSYVGRRKLANIRIEQTVGSGVWIDQNYQPATYNKALLVNSTDIKNLQPSEIKVVEIQIGASNYLGRVAGTDNYLAWVNHNIADGQGVVQIISKSNFIAAANGSGVITSFDNIATIEFGSTSLSSVGFGDSNNFDSASTQQINCIASKGDYLYITMRSLTGSSPYPAIMRVNCVDGTQTVFARTATNAIRTISINANKMVITTGSSVQTVDNFESATLPITI